MTTFWLVCRSSPMALFVCGQGIFASGINFLIFILTSSTCRRVWFVRHGHCEDMWLGCLHAKHTPARRSFSRSLLVNFLKRGVIVSISMGARPRGLIYVWRGSGCLVR